MNEQTCKIPIAAHMVQCGDVWKIDESTSEWADVPVQALASLLYRKLKQKAALSADTDKAAR